MTSPVFTMSRPVSSCHSPLIAACITQLFTGPTPRQVSPLGQSPAVLHGLSLLAHVLGATGGASWSALFTTSPLTVTRTCVSGVGSFRHPATIVPAYPVGSMWWTRRVIGTM